MRGNPQRYAVGLFRVSTAEQGNSGLGLGAQQASVLAADMPGADDLMMRIYAAMAQKEWELISERTRPPWRPHGRVARRWAAIGVTSPPLALTPVLRPRRGRRWLIKPDIGLLRKWRRQAR
jgi:hypothetical protein